MAPGNSILQYEIWHQRLGHCTEDKMRNTQRMVDGMPTFTTPKIPPVVRCRACNIAHLQKAPRGPNRQDSEHISPGQIFQMDIGFFRGPCNLITVYEERRADAESKVVESRQGFICYLLIADRCTRYIWVFPLSSKSVSPSLINIFLQTHDRKDRMVKTIRTDGEGSLSESAIFRQTVATHGYYTLEKTATDTSSQNGLAE